MAILIVVFLVLLFILFSVFSRAIWVFVDGLSLVELGQLIVFLLGLVALFIVSILVFGNKKDKKFISAKFEKTLDRKMPDSKLFKR